MRPFYWFTIGMFLSIFCTLMLISYKFSSMVVDDPDSFLDKRILPVPGTILLTTYTGYTAQIISAFTGRDVNHVAVVGQEKVYEVRSTAIKETRIFDWLDHWNGRPIYTLTPRNFTQQDLHKMETRIVELVNMSPIMSLDLVSLTGLLAGKDLLGDKFFCTKFLAHVLDKDLPLIPAEYVNTTIDGYYPAQRIRVLNDPFRNTGEEPSGRALLQ